MKIRVRVKRVDMDGFLGRDDHPGREDEGVEGTVTTMDLVPEDVSGNEGHFQTFHTRLDNGRNVELMGHEIELVSCTHSGDLDLER